ncbi:BPI fold-containing family B member 1 isoform X2 [Choloepus didactylus]|nr:BPI fold-containing family B member 1 isoform X2 [Choloepus didactylus]XP_037667618.1 BPI fold-containing family B member 1 isoform X2 [Choloepus didactylus]XP_037667619.1 BPI fold-containing family B member 1 isoform X2 [Choloepus didactylus]
MASPWTFTLLCGLLAATLVQATLSPSAVLSLSSEVVKDGLTQELKDHDAISILQQLPLLRAVQEEEANSRSALGDVLTSILKQITWLKVTSANVLQVQVQPSANGQELIVKIPVDMVAGFNTPLVKTIVEIQMEAEAQALIRVETDEQGHSRLVLSDCSNSHGRLRISLLHKLSILVNSLADKVISLLVPALPKLVKSQLCPLIETTFEEMGADLLRLVRAPVPLGSGQLVFDLLSPDIKDGVIQLNLGAKLLDSQGEVTNEFSNSAASLMVPALDGTPFSLVVRQDVVNAAVGTLLPPEELVVLLYSVLPELAQQLKSSIRAIREEAANQLGPTQIVKILTQETPELLLDQGSATVAQLIVLQVFATSEASRPIFTLGIEASSEAQFYTNGDQLMLNLNEISSDRIHLLTSSIGLFNTELLKDIITEILDSILLPNENGKLRSGVLLSIVKALGYEAAATSVTEDAIVITPAAPDHFLLSR